MTLTAGYFNETQLIDALRRRDESAFATLVDQYHVSLIRLAQMYVADRAAAEEVVQETWLGVLKGIDRFEGRSSVKTWLYRILTNIADVEIVSIERKAPGIPQAETPNLRRTNWRDKRITDSVGAGTARIRIEPQYFSEPHGGVLGVIVGVAFSSTIADAGIETTLRSKGQHTAVVIGEIWMRNALQNTHLTGIGLIGIGGTRYVARNRDIAVCIGVIYVEASVCLIVRVKGHP